MPGASGSRIAVNRVTLQCRGCGNLIPDVSIFCLVCGTSQGGLAKGASFDPRAILFWAARELRLPSEILRTIAGWAPRGLKGGRARWSPYHPKLLPLGQKRQTLVFPGSMDPDSCYGGYAALWGRPLHPMWGEFTFTVLLSTACESVLGNLYLVGVCRPTDFANLSERGERHALQPLSSYPDNCFALQIGGGAHGLEVVLDGDGTRVAPHSLLQEALTEDADRVLVSVTIDTASSEASFSINGMPLTEEPVPVPHRYTQDFCYPFVTLNTVGDSVEWVN